MKNEILKILSVYAGHMFQDDFFDGDTLYLIGERQETIEQLTQLMCYREVKGIVFGMSLNINFIDNYVGYFIQWLGKGYPEQTILQAIEQVKRDKNEE